MKNILIFVGQEFIINQPFIEYIKRKASEKLLYINAIKFFNEQDKDIFLEITNAYGEYENLLIITNHKSYPIIAKIVATLFEDNLVAKDDIVVPSKAKEVTLNSFLIKDKKAINVVRTSPCNLLPEILVSDNIESINIYFFLTSRDLLLSTLETISSRTEVEYILTQLTPGFYQASIYNKPYGNIVQFIHEIKDTLPNNCIVAHNLFEYIIDKFSIANKKITFAESCTGGLLSSMLTQVPGSSMIFDGSLITYANTIKHGWLGVKEETLQNFGAVSEETVHEMLTGALRVTKADYAIAISGIAGPGGGSTTKPVGTVVVGAKGLHREEEVIQTFHFQGDRNYIQYQAALQGIKLLFQVASKILF